MVAGFITALQSAVVAIETDLGTAAARNYVRKDGAVTITRHALNLIEGANIGLTVADDAANDRVNVTVALSSVPATPMRRST